MTDVAQSIDLLPASELRPENYKFPAGKLQRCSQSGKIPLVLIACCSYSPPTFLHLRMFSMASDFARMNTDFEVVGGYLSPVSDAYQKAGLVEGIHRWVVLFCQTFFFLSLFEYVIHDVHLFVETKWGYIRTNKSIYPTEFTCAS